MGILPELFSTPLIANGRRGDSPMKDAGQPLPYILSSIHPTVYKTAKAPAGGITIGGKKFAGGQFIPAEVMSKASPEERQAVESGESRSKPLPPSAGIVAPKTTQPTPPPSISSRALAFLSVASQQYRAAEAAEKAARAAVDAATRDVKHYNPNVSYTQAVATLAEAKQKHRLAAESLGNEARLDFQAVMMSGGGNNIESGVASDTKWTADEYDKMSSVNRFVADILSRSHGKLTPVVYMRPTGDRAYYTYQPGWTHAGIAVTRADDAGTYAHELGHHLENHVPGAREKVSEFLEKRTADDTEISLRDTFGNRFDAGERGKADDFGRLYPDDPASAYYTGKVYRDGSGNIINTEILSMGLELLYRDARKFAATDPEYFDLVTSILQPKAS